MPERLTKIAKLSYITKETSILIQPKRSIRVFIIGDIHVPFHDPNAISLCMNLAKIVCPDIIIINGDFIDFFAISRFTKNPARKLQLGDEIKEARNLLSKFMSNIEPAVWIFNAGNHEERLKNYLWSKAPELSTIDELNPRNLLGFNRDNCIWLDYQDTPVQVGHDVVPTVYFPEIFVLHGDRMRMSGGTVNIARSIFLKTLKNSVVSHWHRSDMYLQMDYNGKMRGCWVVPCLCLQRPHWDTGRIWGQGACVLEISHSGFFKVDLISFIKTDGKLMAFYNGLEVTVNAN